MAPRWVGVVIFLTVVTAASQAWLLSTAVGQLALVDQWERTALGFGWEVDDATYVRLQEFSRNGPAYAVLTAVAYGPALTAAVAAGVYVLFRRRPVRSVTFTHVLAIAAHANVILALRLVMAAPIAFARESTASPTSLGLWFPTLDAASVVGRFAGAIDLFVVWWLMVLAVGVAVLYERRARTLAAAFLGVYVGVALLLAAAMTASGGTS